MPLNIFASEKFPTSGQGARIIGMVRDSNPEDLQQTVQYLKQQFGDDRAKLTGNRIWCCMPQFIFTAAPPPL